MKHHVLFCMKNSEQIIMNVVCCGRGWGFGGLVDASAYDCYLTMLYIVICYDTTV